MTNLRLAIPSAAICAIAIVVSAQSTALTIVLTGQSMIRSDLRTTKPAAVQVIKGLLEGDVKFTNLEAAASEHTEPGGFTPHSRKHSHRAAARRCGRRVPTQPRLRPSRVFDDLYRRHAGASRPQPVAYEVDA